ncbi:MAG: lamin tail domain-containing protein [Planctomycetota bacterium]
MRTAFAIAAVAGIAAAANGQVVISEVLGSTSGSDWEFIELVNLGNSDVDLSGWTVELWDSDAGAQFGTGDGGAPYAFSGILGAGDATARGNSLAFNGYGAGNFDGTLQANAIENSSYTIVLADDLGNVVDAIFVNDGDAGDAANRAGSAVSVTATIGPDGSFLPAGFYRIDEAGNFGFLNFGTGDLNDGTLEGGTPGSNQIIPAPASVALLGLGGLAATRRRR